MALKGLNFQKNGTVEFKELNEVLCAMQKVIFRYQGFLRQFLIDDKGRSFLVLF